MYPIKRRKARRLVTIQCQTCHVIVADASHNGQKYCATCSAVASKERQKRWAEKAGKKIETPEQRERRIAKSAADRDGSVARGKKISSLVATKFCDWMPSQDPDPHTVFRFRFPFAYTLSKNAIFSNTADGHVFIRKEARGVRSQISYAIRQACTPGALKEGKIWIDIFVQKPNHKGDAVNVIDLVCDAIKDGLGIDDRWFCIRKIDWEIKKENPEIFVGISQSITCDHRVCSLCGRILPRDQFAKDTPGSTRRECGACRSKDVAEALIAELSGDDTKTPYAEAAGILLTVSPIEALTLRASSTTNCETIVDTDA